YKELKGFTEKVIELVEEPYSKFIDVGLSKSCFSLWLLGSAKEEHIKKPAISSPVKQEFQPIDDENALSRGANLVIAKYSWLQIRKIKKGFINFQAQSICETEDFISKECSICDIKYKKDQLYEFIRKNGHFILKCYQQKQYKPEHKGLSFDKVSDKEIKDAPEAYPDFLNKNLTTTLIHLPVTSGKTKTLREMLDFLAKNEADLPYENNAIMHQMSSGVHAHESESAMHDLLKLAVHVISMDAFANESTLNFLRQYQGSEAIYRGLKMLKEVYTSTVEASISFEISNHFNTVIGISNINTKVHAKAFAQMFYQVRDCPYHIISLYNSKKSSIFKEPNHDLIRAELSALRSSDLPIVIKGHREWNKINDCYTLDSSPSVETYIE
ncbi:35460_t:CDS:2, partial [Gigaspora margarita]